MSRIILMVGFGGFLGSVGRYLVAVFFTKTFSTIFPYGTFVVNIAGCFLIGIFYGLSQHYDWFSADWRLFLATGFCGGFTTFSSFSYENLQLLQGGSYFIFSVYALSSFILGLVGVFAGVFLIKIVAS